MNNVQCHNYTKGTRVAPSILFTLSGVAFLLRTPHFHPTHFHCRLGRILVSSLRIIVTQLHYKACLFRALCAGDGPAADVRASIEFIISLVCDFLRKGLIGFREIARREILNFVAIAHSSAVRDKPKAWCGQLESCAPPHNRIILYATSL